MSARGRFAPSPSGRMHLGNVFSALMAWLSVKSVGGTAVLRIEDLDTARCKPVYTEQLLDDLRYLGLTFDEGEGIGGPHGPYKQSERTEYYEDVLSRLQEQGVIYPCYCSRDELRASNAPHASDGRILYSGRCRALTDEERRLFARRPAYRIKASDEQYTFRDGVFGKQSGFVSQDFGDFIVRRSDGLFAYQLAVVADDIAMGINEVVRGRDLLSSVIPQKQLYDLLGAPSPVYYHVPLLVAPDGRRLSKRDGDLDLGALRNRFSTAEPLIGYLLHAAGLLDHDEPLSAREAVTVFDWNRLSCKDIVVDVPCLYTKGE